MGKNLVYITYKLTEYCYNHFGLAKRNMKTLSYKCFADLKLQTGGRIGDF